MRLFATVVTVSLVSLALASCNTSEALTPRADIGQPGHRSTPVTQADAEEIAGKAVQPVERMAPSEPTHLPLPANAPGNSLEAQAHALNSGQSISPSSSGPPPPWNGQEQSTVPPPAGQTTAPGETASRPPAAEGQATIRFLPIIGAPVEAITPLSRRLGAEARAAGLAIRPSTDDAAQNILKGYFSAFIDEGKVTVVYVWDILDASGARLNRMQGQESVAASGTDAWAAVPASLMETIATKTMHDYSAWRRAQSG